VFAEVALDWQRRMNGALDYIEAELEGDVSWREAASLAALELPLDVADRLRRPEGGGLHLGDLEAHGRLPAAIQDTYRRIFGEWFPTSSYEHAGGPELEVYPPGDRASPGYVCEVWIPIVRVSPPA